MLWTLQRVFLGTLPEKWSGLTDINTRELITLVPLAILVIYFGIFPMPMLDLMNASANHLVEFIHSGAGMAVLGR